jgi:exopolysaccharide biosynthesis polyprenyl glycosylphosphotransferase
MAMAISSQHDAPIGALLWLLPTLPVWAFIFWSYDLYRRPIRRLEPTHLDDIPSLFHALILGGLGLWLYYRFVVPAPQLQLEEMVIFGLVSLPLIASLRATLRSVNRRLQGPERVFAVAPIDDVRLLQRKLSNHPEYEMELTGAVTSENGAGELGLTLTGDFDEIEDLLATGQIDHLVVRLDAHFIPQPRVQELMRACHRESVRFGCFPGVKALLFPGIEVNHIEGMGILSSNPPVFAPTARRVKRILDVAVAAPLLLVLAPAMALIAIAIKLDSKGPVLYRQTRVGKHGRRFTLLKFRTMVPDADQQVETLMANSRDPHWLILDNDPRVTRVGRLLRRNSLDELPQLWNVLRGEMSLVGPRPLPERDDDAVLDWHRHRLDLIPGLTGSWQVLGRNNIPFQEMLEIDYAYMANWSLWEDVKILAQTVTVVLTRRGAN